MKINRILFLSFVFIWMITIFTFSHQPAELSSNTSGNTIRLILNHIPIIKDFETEQKENIIETLQPIVRKIAHLSIYTLGGMLLYLLVNTYNINEIKKIIISILLGITYATTDEIHQLLIPRKGWADTRYFN